ncbi:MAG: metallophosphoesterase [Chthoniobacter sp.]
MHGTIVHLSDLHLSSREAWVNFEATREAILGLKPAPQIIIVSGDLLDHPDDALWPQIQQSVGGILGRPETADFGSVEKALRQLCQDCGDATLVVVPGNHDCRTFGLVGRSESGEAFDAVFPQWREPKWRRVGAWPTAVFCLDSNTNDARVNAARGRVGTPELLRFGREFKALSARHGEDFQKAFKIVVLHHHPVPIADSEATNYFGKDGFLGLDDAGIFLREMADKGVDLVLHGHKHYPLQTHLRVQAGKITRELAVIAAGSACKAGHENSFNHLTLERRAVYNCLRRHPPGAAYFAGDTQAIISPADYRERAYQAFLEDPQVKYSTVTEVFNCTIMENGDGDFSDRRWGVRCARHQAQLENVPVFVGCGYGIVAGYQAEKISTNKTRVHFERDGNHRDGIASGAVVFSPPLSPPNGSADPAQTETVDFEESFRFYNAFALTEEQLARISKGRKMEHVGLTIRNPVGELIICVRFAYGEMPSEIHLRIRGVDPALDELKSGMTGGRAAVEKPKGEPAPEGPESNPPSIAEPPPKKVDVPDPDEWNYQKGHLQISKLHQTATLRILKPLQGLSYGIEWNLPSVPKNRRPVFQEGTCEWIRQQLLALDAPGLETNLLRPIFREEHARLAREFSTPLDQLELGLMVFDPGIQRLRFVAGRMPPACFTFQLWEGQGIAGRAHKMNSTLVYVSRRVDPLMDFSAAGVAGRPKPEIIICVPLRFPVSQVGDTAGEVIGVVTLSTDHPASKLLTIDSVDNSRAQAMILEFQILFLDRILPAIGFDSLPEK